MNSLRTGVTVVIPSIPPRMGRHLHRALDSVQMQTRSVDAVSVVVDQAHLGAAATRNEALAAVRTQWCVFLDDDDVLDPDHVELLMAHQQETGADLVYPWFRVENGFDPFPQYEGHPFEERALREIQNFIPVTVLARTELIRESGGFQPLGPPDNPCDDYGAWLALLNAGAKFSHLNRRTWSWVWHGGEGGNTSGRGDRW